MKNYVIVIGTSAGGLSPLKAILKALPKDFPCPILIVKHISPNIDSPLPNILMRYSQIPIISPADKQKLEPNRIYIAPPNLHMTIENNKVRLKHGPKVNHSRPAIDPLFSSAALAFGSNTIGILLSGLLDDGSAGLLAIKRSKGIVIVQKAEDAEYPDMPRNALRYVAANYNPPGHEIGPLLLQVAEKGEQSEPFVKENPVIEHEFKMDDASYDIPQKEMNEIGKPSFFTCPACHGVLWEIKDSDILRYRCRVGHAYNSENLLEARDNELENALWAALRALEEKENLIKRMVEKAAKHGAEHATTIIEKAKKLKQHVRMLRMILNGEEI